MLSCVLRGITTALLVTLLTLVAGMLWGTMGLGGLSVSNLVDIGLLASCLIGGYRTSRESGEWIMGGITGLGYVTVGTLLLALFLPIRVWGFIQILGEGAILGIIAGAFGAGGSKGSVRSSWGGGKANTNYRPYYAGYGSEKPTGSDLDWDMNDDLHSREGSSAAGSGPDTDDWSTDLDQEDFNSGLSTTSNSKLNSYSDSSSRSGSNFLLNSKPDSNLDLMLDNSMLDLESDIKSDSTSASNFEIDSLNSTFDSRPDSQIEWPWDRELEDEKKGKADPVKGDHYNTKDNFHITKDEKPWWE
ncbi:TIGR04086 family membrane protein [Desulfosporosinus sp. FKB]|uniref:TIGR04086 family membrane protein n=1 Tax=Desulfosporosinus sp. FKB TaxID=1969835 RepID=UPI000B498BBE|nr:TIGR04086 family membrane protein [Desulfosporosinus sp. FKB]